MECRSPNPKCSVSRIRHCRNESRSFIEVVSPTRFRHCRERRLTGNVRLLLIPLISLRVHPQVSPRNWGDLLASDRCVRDCEARPGLPGDLFDFSSKSEFFLNCGELALAMMGLVTKADLRLDHWDIQYSIGRRSSVTNRISFWLLAHLSESRI